MCLLSPLPFYSELSLSPRSPSFDPGIAASRDSEEEAKIRCRWRLNLLLGLLTGKTLLTGNILQVAARRYNVAEINKENFMITKKGFPVV